MAVPAGLTLAFRRAAVRRVIRARQVLRFRRRVEREGPSRRRVIVTVAGFVALVVLPPMLAIIVAVAGTPGPASRSGVSAYAAADIPAEALAAYQDAAAVWRMDWSILAAVGKVECDHGRSQLAGC